MAPWMELDKEQCQQARTSRDPRFDGRFFVAVKTTNIFCRPICPATLPKEKNVEYFANSVGNRGAAHKHHGTAWADRVEVLTFQIHIVGNVAAVWIHAFHARLIGRERDFLVVVRLVNENEVDTSLLERDTDNLSLL